jgi:hypothetical protein
MDRSSALLQALINAPPSSAVLRRDWNAAAGWHVAGMCGLRCGGLQLWRALFLILAEILEMSPPYST